MKTVIVGLLALSLTTGCNRSDVQGRPQPAKSSPGLSKVEEFNLRGKCAALADAMTPAYGLVGPTLTSEVLSHYNPNANRCYVQFTTTKNFSYTYPSVPANYLTVAVYDGQTKEMLVFASKEGEKSSGQIFAAQSFDDRYVTFDKASAEIDRLMQNGDNAQGRSK